MILPKNLRDHVLTGIEMGAEVIALGRYNLLVEPADPGDLAEKILVALDREWDRDAILAYAERFTWENIAKEIMGVYTQILE